ncbi:hypothetical protein DFH06DRAFT_1388423 [Mycena polygramma]|nr:hypothetical protein DFH06DRAFT_1388423 [Mycena polygramma]
MPSDRLDSFCILLSIGKQRRDAGAGKYLPAGLDGRSRSILKKLSRPLGLQPHPSVGNMKPLDFFGDEAYDKNKSSGRPLKYPNRARQEETHLAMALGRAGPPVGQRTTPMAVPGRATQQHVARHERRRAGIQSSPVVAHTWNERSRCHTIFDVICKARDRYDRLWGSPITMYATAFSGAARNICIARTCKEVPNGYGHRYRYRRAPPVPASSSRCHPAAPLQHPGIIMIFSHVDLQQFTALGGPAPMYADDVIAAAAASQPVSGRTFHTNTG